MSEDSYLFYFILKEINILFSKDMLNWLKSE